MRYKLLGRSGLKVSELCLGTMTFGEDYGWGASKDESRKMFDAYVEAGGNFIDTADYYTAGTSEKYVGEFIASERSRFVLATKYTLNRRADDPNAGGSHRKSLVEALEGSLRRLNTGYIDLYWVHTWDTFTPVEEVMRALDDQVRAGKVLYVGISNWPAWMISEANTLAACRGWSPFVALQTQYSLIERASERELLPMAKAFDIGITAWSPLGGGVLAGKYNLQDSGPKRFGPQHPRSKDFLTERNLAIAQSVLAIAGEIGRTPSQVALNWVCRNPRHPVIIPIIGGRREAHIKDNLDCLDFELPPPMTARLDEVSDIELGYPHDYLALPFIRGIAHGKTWPLVDNHRK
ncbi:MAG TPA: aldo/keto reductase [Candidatus Aminicenantes bacterium]|nr:aldo/keto reductase [Candidatus Aminicenantes bacterium]